MTSAENLHRSAHLDLSDVPLHSSMLLPHPALLCDLAVQLHPSRSTAPQLLEQTTRLSNLPDATFQMDGMSPLLPLPERDGGQQARPYGVTPRRATERALLGEHQAYQRQRGSPRLAGSEGSERLSRHLDKGVSRGYSMDQHNLLLNRIILTISS